mgnify:CR=1 FL=1
MTDSAGYRRIHAKLCGAALPAEPWRGEVKSVFTRAINIIRSGSELVSLVTEPLQMTDFSLLLPSLPRLTEGMKVRGDAFSLTAPDSSLPSHRSVSPVEIDLRRCTRWSGSISPPFCQALTFGGEFSEKPALLENALGNSHAKEGLLGIAAGEKNLWARKAERSLTEASAAAHREEPPDLSPLIGLGVGFTPSGDDFIVGACAAEELLRHYSEERALPAPPRIARDPLREKAGATTYGGAALLRSAAAGSYSALILELLRQLTAAHRMQDYAAAVETAETYGETSGIDSLTGIWWYLDLARPLLTFFPSSHSEPHSDSYSD